jgi:electron transfer flavoprotein alpha subunit
MADVLAFAEQRDGQIGSASREAVSTAARLAGELGGSAHVLAVGGVGLSDAVGALGPAGAASIAVAEHEALAQYNPEGYAQVVARQIRSLDPAAVILPATTLGKDLAPRVAAMLDVPLASDATGIEVEDGKLSVLKPIYSGKAFAYLSIDAAPAIITIRPNVFPIEQVGAAGEVATFTPDIEPSSWRVRVLERRGADDGALDVAEATTIVSGGRGMKDPENWGLLESLKEALGPGVALGASRAVVDAGWRPHGEQVGQTGKTVAPKLYFAIGISGAIQHLAGMRTSQTIVAVNKDADAPIFGVADYGVVGDLFEILPRLAEEVAALKGAD